MTSKIIFCPKCNGPIRVGKHLSFQYQQGSQIEIVIRTDERARNRLLPAKVYLYMYKTHMYIWESDEGKFGHA